VCDKQGTGGALPWRNERGSLPQHASLRFGDLEADGWFGPKTEAAVRGSRGCASAAVWGGPVCLARPGPARVRPAAPCAPGAGLPAPLRAGAGRRGGPGDARADDAAACGRPRGRAGGGRRGALHGGSGGRPRGAVAAHRVPAAMRSGARALLLVGADFGGCGPSRPWRLVRRWCAGTAATCPPTWTWRCAQGPRAGGHTRLGGMGCACPAAAPPGPLAWVPAVGPHLGAPRWWLGCGCGCGCVRVRDA
jgi:hypothetical protein